MNVMEEYIVGIGICLSALFVIAGCMFQIEVARLRRHIDAATLLMDKGVPEPEAMQLSGCNHWDQPFFVRIWKKYPKLPS